MKLGILGTGMIVREFLSLLEKLDVEGVSLLARERSWEKALALSAQYGLEQCCRDYDELLPLVDTVYVALPNDLHHPYAKKALLAGKHVIAEKPATSDLRELKELAALAREKGVMLFEAMTTHHLPTWQAVKKALPRIGQPRLAVLNFSQYSSRYDAFQAGDVKPAFDPAHSGGALMDLNIYNIHALLGLFGPPQGVHYSANLQRGIDTSGILTLDYPGFKAACIAAKDCSGPNGCVLEGEKGVLQVPDPVSLASRYELRLRDGTVETYAVEGAEHRMLYEFREFFRCIREGDQGTCDALLTHSLDAMEILDSARKQAGVVYPTDR